MELTLTIGTRITELRKQKGMSQEELCNAAGISRKAMHNIESGKCSVGIKTLYKITKVLDISVSEFFSTFNSDYEI
jgi:HTH-type transcriptional repressor of puuD